jgi:hypothetical protein
MLTRSLRSQHYHIRALWTPPRKFDMEAGGSGPNVPYWILGVIGVYTIYKTRDSPPPPPQPVFMPSRLL